MAKWKLPSFDSLNQTTAENASPERSESGIALFMVISALTILSVLVTEFTYVSQVNKKLAYDGIDQIKAHYLAKSGLKISLLRLKAYQNVKSIMSSMGGGASAGASAALPKALIEKIWSFPFMYPIPSVPGLSLNDRDALEKFQKESSLEGSYTAVIESESSRFNLNAILAAYAPTPSPSPSPSPSVTPGPEASPSPLPSFDPEAARTSLTTHLNQILQNKFQQDPDFADEYRNFRLEDLIDGISAWADRTYEQKNLAGREAFPAKRAPFYSLTELHLVRGMDDGLYALFAPSLTVSPTPGINVNTMQEPMLKALVPAMTEEEIKEFFKFRDSPTEDHLFRTPEDFLKYLQSNVQAFANNESEIRRFQENLKKRGVYFVVDESQFKITVQARVGQATRTIEAWVMLTTPRGSAPGGSTTPGTPISPPAGPPAGGGASYATDSTQAPQVIDTRAGLRVLFMRAL